MSNFVPNNIGPILYVNVDFKIMPTVRSEVR